MLRDSLYNPIGFEDLALPLGRVVSERARPGTWALVLAICCACGFASSL